MKRTLIEMEPEKPKKSYPYLGEFKTNTHLIVYFTVVNHGILLYSNNESYPLNKGVEWWAEENFIPFTGKLELSN